MATAKTTKTTTEEKPAAAPAKRNYRKSVPVNFSAVSIDTDDEPISLRSGVSVGYTPPPAIVEALTDSWAQRRVLATRKNKDGQDTTTYIGIGKGLTVDTEDQATTVVRAIRKAAKHMDLGAAVETLPTSDGRFRVRFAAKTARNYPKGVSRKS